MNHHLVSNEENPFQIPTVHPIVTPISIPEEAQPAPEAPIEAPEDDCAIIEPPPIRPNSPDSGENLSENVDEDISVRVDKLAESFTLPHPRYSCPKFNKFQFTEIKNHIIETNEHFCPKCFCYLCQVE